MSDADLKLNDRLKQEEIENLHLAGGESSDAAAMAEMAEGNDNAFESNMDKLVDMIVERLEQRMINESKDSKKKSKKNIKKIEDKQSDNEIKEEE